MIHFRFALPRADGQPTVWPRLNAAGRTEWPDRLHRPAYTISGIDADGALLDYDYEEVRATQTILAHARQTFLVADHTKFTRRPMIEVGRLEQVDRVERAVRAVPGFEGAVVVAVYMVAALLRPERF